MEAKLMVSILSTPFWEFRGHVQNGPDVYA